jgi:hypothetical protein
MELLPLSAEELVEKLDKEIPERCPTPSQAERDIWMYAGKRALVNHLLNLLDDTRQAQLTGSP